MINNKANDGNDTAQQSGAIRQSQKLKIDKMVSSHQIDQQAVCFGVTLDNMILI